MIAEKLTHIGRFNKPHGIHGEIAATVDVDLSALRCIVVNVEGIDVPFFITSLRPKGPENVLLKLDGYETEEQIKAFVNKDIYALSSEVPEDEGLDPDADGFYAADLVGFTAIEGDTRLGVITDIDDQTDNVLFIIDTGREGEAPLLVPVADEFIIDIDTDAKTIEFALPEGLKAL